MKRREFIEKAGYGAAGIAASPITKAGGGAKEPIVLRRYDMEVEVYEVGRKRAATNWERSFNILRTWARSVTSWPAHWIRY